MDANMRQNGHTIDFSSIPPAREFAFRDRLSFGGVRLTRGRFRPSEGVSVRSSEVTVAIHQSESFWMDWRGPESDRLRRNEIARGHAHVGDGRHPFWVRCRASPSFFAFTMDETFVAQLWEKAFEGAGDFELRIAIGVEDPVIDRIGALGLRELNADCTSGRIYVESLASALAVHLLGRYGASTRVARQYKGGLSARLHRRVVEYIDEHLRDDLTLAELASIAELSPNHFAIAFKATAGIPPHRYIIEKRIDRARMLLRRSDQPISEIAYAVGFSSQSHLTANFRGITGITPNRFRRSLT